jgi:hypothetical protein
MRFAPEARRGKTPLERVRRLFLRRSERPPAVPRDWVQPVQIAGREPILRELERFARDPDAREHRFRAPAGERATVDGASGR